MSGRSKAETAARRWSLVWLKHDRRLSNAEIARALGVTENTVRYYLAKGQPPDYRNNRATRPATIRPVVADRSCGVIPLRRRA